ncbi:D-alanyl-D-alanine carboxypeptidase family protein [Parafrankia sp. EUN1f]|uniref:D-alanyl-D-alanine carboxypeptidase family protein n=1 Tax=Parafrankia sp. EUN1f TaxID=102897 RepID=UPI0001C45FF5|nr:D-alanyl-D-alanine carboxypeptidase family protein [Parafrankia sp. EUN1f]EFC81255.1 peptidase S11 D-alanyl-D-alanine carboxypeptidase 1 [Parafrankia sp. EUN1f]
MVSSFLLAIAAAPATAATATATATATETAVNTTAEVAQVPPPWSLTAPATPGEPQVGAVSPPTPAAALTAGEPTAPGNGRPGASETSVPEPAGITAEAWMVADAISGAILAAHNPNLPDLPASTMKMLTALTVLPSLPPDRVVTISDEAARVDGTRVGLVPGVRYTVRDLATAMLIASGNDATVALVEAAGGRDAVLERMNRLAASLGAHDTVAGDPTGLDAPGQHTTAHDLAVIGRAVLNNPTVRAYLTIPRAVLPGRGDERFEIANHNTLLGTYEGTIGIKNGYTIAAGATFVGAAVRDGRTLIVSLLRTAPTYATDAKALLDWGFAHAADVRPLGRLAEPARTDPATAAQASAGTDTGTGGPGPAQAADAAAGGDGRGGDGDSKENDRFRQAAVPADSGGGVGTATWVALAITVAVSALTLLGRTRRRADAIQRAPRPPARHGHHHRHRDGHRRRTRARELEHQEITTAPAAGRARVARPGGPISHEATTTARLRHGRPSAPADRRAGGTDGARPHPAPGAHARPRSDGRRHLVGLPSLLPDPPRPQGDDEERRRTDTPPFGTARSPAP